MAFEYVNSSTLISDVIGISLQCGEEICATNNITLNKLVKIVFNHDKNLEVSELGLQHNIL